MLTLASLPVVCKKCFRVVLFSSLRRYTSPKGKVNKLLCEHCIPRK